MKPTGGGEGNGGAFNVSGFTGSIIRYTDNRCRNEGFERERKRTGETDIKSF